MINQTSLKDKQIHQSGKLNTISNLSNISMNDIFHYNKIINKMENDLNDKNDLFNSLELTNK